MFSGLMQNLSCPGQRNILKVCVLCIVCVRSVTRCIFVWLILTAQNSLLIMAGHIN